MKCRRERPAKGRQFAAAAAITFSLLSQDASPVLLDSLMNEIQRMPVLALKTTCTKSNNREGCRRRVGFFLSLLSHSTQQTQLSLSEM